jgi:multidrug efflux pump subunit AcrA (membrane-fusion protein)
MKENMYMHRSIRMLVLILVIVGLGCAKPPEEKEIKKSKDTIEIVFEGVITPSKEEKLLSPISGKISRINLNKEKKVEKNQVIAEFERKEMELAYRKAKADYERSVIAAKYYSPVYPVNRVIINNAKERLLKTYDLYKTDMASLAELKTAEDNYVSALTGEMRRTQDIERAEFDKRKAEEESGKDMEKARLDMAKAKYDLEHSRIVAPIDGYLADFNVSEGQNLSKGELIGRVVDIGDVFLKGAISPGTYKYLKVGTSINVSCLTVPPTKAKGVISAISPIVDPESGRMSVYVPLKNPDYLLQPGVKCLVSFIMPKLISHRKSACQTSSRRLNLGLNKTLQFFHDRIFFVNECTKNLPVYFVRDDIGYLSYCFFKTICLPVRPFAEEPHKYFTQ